MRSRATHPRSCLRAPVTACHVQNPLSINYSALHKRLNITNFFHLFVLPGSTKQCRGYQPDHSPPRVLTRSPNTLLIVTDGDDGHGSIFTMTPINTLSIVRLLIYNIPKLNYKILLIDGPHLGAIVVCDVETTPKGSSQ